MEQKMDSVHPAISINSLSLGPVDFEEAVTQVARLGVTALSPTREQIIEFGLPKARRRLRDAELAVATVTHRAFGYATAEEATAARIRLNSTIALAAEIDATTITFTTGGRAGLRWDEAALRFSEAIATCDVLARKAGVVLSLEPTSHLYADVSIVHRLSDVLRLATPCGVGVGIDLFACWGDADIEDAICQAGKSIALVQVSDYMPGDRSLPCRAVPGDGVIPLARLIPLISQKGFSGYFDIEVIGPRLAAEGIETGLSRAVTWLTPVLQAAMAVRETSPGR